MNKSYNTKYDLELYRREYDEYESKFKRKIH